MKLFQNRFLTRVALYVTCIFLCGGMLGSGNSKGKGKGGKGGGGSEETPQEGSNPQANGNGAGQGQGSPEGESPTAENIAAIIAADAGGDSDQYLDYAARLAKTLASLTPEQRARVFSD